MKNRKQTIVGPRASSAKTSKGKLLPVLGVLSLLLGLQAATQFFAYKFQYQAILGSNLANVYAPWAILQWSARWYGLYPNEIMSAGSIGMVVATVGLLGVAIAKVVASNTSKASAYLHGSARWAEKKDIRAAGLLARPRTFLEALTGKKTAVSNGVYVGGWIGKGGVFHYLRHSGSEHVLCYAPTRSGKAVGLVVPTLLSWPSSAVITDLKGELWARLPDGARSTPRTMCCVLNRQR